MRKMLTALILCLATASALARETITVYSPYSAGHAGTNASRRVFEAANSMQDRYQFVLDFKPGAQGVLALKEISEQPGTRLAIINAAFVDNVEKNLINEHDYVPVHSDGDACWAVVSTAGNERQGLPSIQSAAEIVVGSVGFGNATHLTALEIGKKYNLPVRFIPFKSNFDSMLNMAAGHGVNFNLERISVIESFKTKNPNLQILAMSCPVRHPDAPNVRTLKEYGIRAPYVFNTVVAHQHMPQDRAADLGKILDQATLQVGADVIRQLSDFRPSVFDNVSAVEFHRSRLATVKSLRQQHRNAIEADRK